MTAAACGGSEGSSEQAAAVPARAGDVWELDAPADRAAAPAALVAFVNGVHVIVVDGDDVYAGTEKLTAKPGDGGARRLRLPADSSAQLVSEGDALSVRFTSGESVRYRKQAPRAQAAR